MTDDCIEIVQVAENHFAVRMTVDLGVGGDCSQRVLWTGVHYEEAILYAERLGTQVRLPVIDMVAA